MTRLKIERANVLQAGQGASWFALSGPGLQRRTQQWRRPARGLFCQDQIADGLKPAIEAILDDLDRWLALSTS